MLRDTFQGYGHFPNPLTDAEKEFIDKNFPAMCMKELTRHLHRAPKTIKAYLDEIGKDHVVQRKPKRNHSHSEFFNVHVEQNWLVAEGELL